MKPGHLSGFLTIGDIFCRLSDPDRKLTRSRFCKQLRFLVPFKEGPATVPFHLPWKLSAFCQKTFPLFVPKRDLSLVAKAPQSFILKDIYATHLQAQKDGEFNAIDSCTLMYRYNPDLAVVMTDYDNIKITTMKDITLGESIFERRAKESV